MTAQPSARLILNFTSYWLAGGGTAGAGVDEVTWRDRCGFPAMPMTQIKGQLRETAERLYPRFEVDKMFGAPGSNRAPIVFQGEARLPDDLQQWFRNLNQDAAKELLFRRIASTAIDESGVAKDRSLRRMEVAVPLTLHGMVVWRDSTPPLNDEWIDFLNHVCAFTPAFGKGKADGFGRAIAQVTKS